MKFASYTTAWLLECLTWNERISATFEEFSLKPDIRTREPTSTLILNALLS